MRQAVILAGGAGTRLWPLTIETPKPMIEVNGKPFLLYIIEELKKYDIKNFVFCVGYLADHFKDFFGDGQKFGVHIVYSIEKNFIGTGGALKLAVDQLADEFFVVNGDTYLPIDYSKVYDKFASAAKTGLLVLYNNQEKIAEPNISVGPADNVTAYVKKEELKQGDRKIVPQKNKQAPCKYVDAGVQVFSKSVLDLIPDRAFVSLEVDIFPELIARNDLTAYVTDQRYYDLGTPERLEFIKQVLA
ncbi:NDP-sugar synthase [Candidatus Margulisiibacteriota bacterium]